MALPQPLEAVSARGGVRRILSLDPGVTTGYAAAYYSTDRLSIGVDEHVWTPRGLYDWLKVYLRESNAPTTIIYEGFEYRNKPRTGLNLTPVELIGVIKIFKERHEPIVDFVMQSAASGKAFFSDDKLKVMGAYKPGKKHGRDATRHLLQWANFGAGAQWIDLQNCEIILS
jgi:hypothetical protein